MSARELPTLDGCEQVQRHTPSIARWRRMIALARLGGDLGRALRYRAELAALGYTASGHRGKAL